MSQVSVQKYLLSKHKVNLKHPNKQKNKTRNIIVDSWSYQDSQSNQKKTNLDYPESEITDYRSEKHWRDR